MIIFGRDLAEVVTTELTPREGAALASATFMYLAADFIGLGQIEPECVEYFREQHGFTGDDLKVVGEGETEILSFAYPVRDRTEGQPYLLYEGSLIVAGGPEDGRLIYRSVGNHDALLTKYRELRYGSLLRKDRPLPRQHLIQFERIPNIPHPTQLVAPAPDWHRSHFPAGA